MPVSIIIPSLDSPLIHRVLDAVRAQTRWDQVSEVVVVGKDKAGLVRGDDVVRFIDSAVPVGPGAARNIGIQATSGDPCVFLDSDCLPAPRWLEEHLKAQAAGHSVVGGGVAADGANYWALCYNLTMFHESLAGGPARERSFLPTLNLSVARRVIREVGLLREDMPRAEDMEWTARMTRAGYRPYFWPEAEVRHEHARLTFESVWRDCVRSGFFSQKLRAPQQRGTLTGWLLGNPFLMTSLSPALAVTRTAYILRRGYPWRAHWDTLPVLFATKIAWCVGASRAAREGG